MPKWFPFGRRKTRRPQNVTVVNVSDDNFLSHVVRRSYKKPVMVDFWAAWCVPCRRLGPVLEKLATEENSPFVLAKLNTEFNPKMSARFHIRSIPAVKMFRNGQVVGEFTGVLSEPTIRRFVDEKSVAPAPGPKKRVKGKQGKQKAQSTAQRLSKAKQHLKRGRGFEAFLLLRDFPESQESEQAEALLPLARFIVNVDDGDGLTGDDTFDGVQLDAVDALERGDPATALDCLFTAREMLEPEDEVAIEPVIRSLFALLGDDHSLTQEYTPRLEGTAI